MRKGSRQLKPPKTLKPGATLRLELHSTWFAAECHYLHPAEIGELMDMLMAEVIGDPVANSPNEAVQTSYDNRRRYSRIRGSFGRGRLPDHLRRKVYDRDDGVCRYCKSDVAWADYHCDHVVPVKRGGTDDLKNLATSCRPCNLSKAAKPLKAWLQ